MKALSAIPAPEIIDQRASLPAANVLTRVLIRSLCSVLNSEIMFREVENADHPEIFPYWIEGVVKGEIEGILAIGTEKSTLRSLAMSLRTRTLDGKADTDAALTKLHQAIYLELERQFSQDDFQCRLGPVTGVQHSFQFVPKAGPCLICPVETKYGILRIFFSLEGSTPLILDELMRSGGTASERKVRVFASQIESLFTHVKTLEALEERLLAGAHVRAQLRSEIKKVKRILHYIKCEPLEMVFVPGRRLVTELSKEQGKQVKLVTHGTWLYLDKGLLSHIYEPILHLIRNAVDHGIEDPPERERRGKPAVGTIRCLAAFTVHGLRMIVSDDGQGLDLARIKAAAVARGILSAEQADSLMMSEMGPLVFEPGLSTRPRPDSVSGRGFGLSHVKNCLGTLSGSIRLLSSSHHGTSFEIIIPLDENLQLKSPGIASALIDPGAAEERHQKLIDELGGYLERLGVAANLFEKDRSAGSAYECFRLVHAIKGIAGFLGWNRVVSFCHELEDMLRAIADEKVPLRAALLELLISSCHSLREFSEASASGATFPLLKIRSLEGQLLQQLWSHAHPNERGQFYFGKYHLKAVRELIAPASPRSALTAKPEGDVEKAVAQPLGAIVQFSGDRSGYAGILLSEDAFINVVHPFITGRVEVTGIHNRLWALSEFARIMGSQLSGLCRREGVDLKYSAPLAYHGWGQPLSILGRPTYCYLCEMNEHSFYLVGDFLLPHDALERSVKSQDFSYSPPVVIREAMNLCRNSLRECDLEVSFDELSSQSDLVGFESGLTAVITCAGNPSTVLFMSFDATLADYLHQLARQKDSSAVELHEYLGEFGTAIGTQLVKEMERKDIRLQLSLPSVFIGQAYVANFNRLFLTNKLTGNTEKGRFELHILVTQMAESG